MHTLQRQDLGGGAGRLAERGETPGPHPAEPAQQAASVALRPATISEPVAAATSAGPDLESWIERTCTRLFEALAIEQERRGVTPWL